MFPEIVLTKEEVNAIDPKLMVVNIWVGSDDILTRRMDEVMEECKAETLVGALDWVLEDVGGNSFTVVVFHNGKLEQLNPV